MKKTTVTKLLSILLCFALIAAIALFTTGCDKKNKTTISDSSTVDAVALGQGTTQFNLKVVGMNGKEKLYDIHTDKTTVGEALLDLGMIAGEESNFGMYIKTVDGETVDFDKDGKYWAFYIDGAYAITGAENTEITPHATYAFIAE